MLKRYCSNWISHCNHPLMISMFQKKSLHTYLQLKNNLSMYGSLNRLSFAEGNQVMDYLASHKINLNITYNRSISNTNVIKQKSDLNDKVQYKDSLLARRNRNASKRERILWYRKQFVIFNLHLLGTVGFILLVCWASPDQRKHMNGKAPVIGQCVDLVLGPFDEKNPETDTVETTEVTPKKESNAKGKD